MLTAVPLTDWPAWLAIAISVVSGVYSWWNGQQVRRNAINRSLYDQNVSVPIRTSSDDLRKICVDLRALEHGHGDAAVLRQDMESLNKRTAYVFYTELADALMIASADEGSQSNNWQRLVEANQEAAISHFEAVVRGDQVPPLEEIKTSARNARERIEGVRSQLDRQMRSDLESLK